MPANRVSSWLLLVTVAVAPLPFGSTNPTTIAAWCGVLGIATVAASPRALLHGQYVLLGLLAIVITAFGFVLHEQLAAQPWFATPHPIWKEASEALGAPIEPSASIARYRPFYALGAPLANVLALICSFVVCTDRKRAHQLLKVFAWSGLVYAVYGIVAFVLDPTRILGREKLAYLDVLTSTFVNRNTAAIYFGSCAIVWLLFMTEQLRQHLPDGPVRWRTVLRRLSTNMPRALILSFSIFFVCLAAMFMTGSRAGVVLSLMMLVVAFATYFYRGLPGRSGVLIVLVAGAAIALALLQIMGAGVSGRFNLQGLADEGRWEAYRSTWRMIADHPWFGTGLGTFAMSFPAYRSAHVSVSGVWDLAHSTPLEMAAELGLPFAGLVAVAWGIALVVLVCGVVVRRRDVMVPIAALMIAVLALLHSLIDFSLQIPGYAIIVFALLGAGLAQSFSSRKGISTSGGSDRMPPP
jgi:O-antigen ligase